MLSRYRVGRFADSVHAGEAVEDDGTTLGPRPPHLWLQSVSEETTILTLDSIYPSSPL
jgi:hypothetical protein